MFFHFPYKSLRPKRGDFHFKFLVLLLSLVSFVSTQAQPRVLIQESKKNFGSVKRGELIILTYTLKNAGDAPLLLLESEVSCSCTEVKFDSSPILPGKSSLIQLQFNTKTVWGRQDREVYITTNSPEKEFRLRYKGQVSKE